MQVSNPVLKNKTATMFFTKNFSIFYHHPRYVTIMFEDVAYEPDGAWKREVHHFMSPYTGVFLFGSTMFIVVIV